MNQFVTFDDLTKEQQNSALKLGWHKNFVAFRTKDEAAKNYYQVSSPESGAGFSEQEIVSAGKSLRNTEIYLIVKDMASEFDKLSTRGNQLALACGYQRIYRDYPTTEEARAALEATISDTDAKQQDITGAINALRNTCIVVEALGYE